MRRHPLIAIEGIDGSGKNTQAKRLVSWLISSGLAASYFDFPHYENVTGQLILSHLHGNWSATDKFTNTHASDELVFQCLMTVNRYEEAGTISKLLDSGPVVLDRYWPSGYVYGAVNGLSSDFLIKIHSLLAVPDVCILVDVPIDESWKRRPERRDRYESQAGMLTQVRAAYLALFASRGWPVVNGVGSLDEVSARIQAVIPRTIMMGT